MIRNVEHYAAQTAEQAKKRAGNRTGYAFKAFCRAWWRTAEQDHPEVAPARLTFFRITGLV
jgi:hypothetical protein